MVKEVLSLENLNKLYCLDKKSVPEISKFFCCSPNKINYWLKKYQIKKRSISEAIYLQKNPNGDPFRFIPPKTKEESELFGLGLGLYWGEGNKANKNTVRLGNSDPNLIKRFMEFLIKFFNIKKSDFKFHLHLFTDININEAQNYWIDCLGLKREQFYRPVVSRSGSLGTYKNKSKYGVLTLYYCNVKLKKLLMELLPM